MSPKFTRILLGVTAIGAVTFSLASVSWSMPPFAGHSFGGKGGFDLHIASELELTQEQRDAVSARLQASRDSVRDDMRRLHELRRQGRALHEDFDAGEAQKLADEVGEITSRLTFTRLSTRAELNQLLTAEQREELKELKAERRERRREFHDWHEQE